LILTHQLGIRHFIAIRLTSSYDTCAEYLMVKKMSIRVSVHGAFGSQ
jgi:hypothetical protein